MEKILCASCGKKIAEPSESLCATCIILMDKNTKSGWETSSSPQYNDIKSAKKK
jgi:NMD protein affecting ribosome stability and mRNA decay